VELMNTLYITTQMAYLHLDHDTVRVEVDRKTLLRVPLIHLEGLICFGDVLVSPALLRRCGEDGRGLVFLSRTGRFSARLVGPASGNVLLRRAQHLTLSDPLATTLLARNIVSGKIQNARQVLLRAAREASTEEDAKALRDGATELATALERAVLARDLDTVRGCEGNAARSYFERVDHMVRIDRSTFSFPARTRRPPRDPLNALLSFLYALVLSDCVAALEGVGLDPQVGYLHALRPGRPALALDLLEEFRPMVADRLALSLINRRQVTKEDFEFHPGGAVLLAERGRREVVAAYQKRKQEQVRHRVLDRLVPLGLIPHVQARLLARNIRGDIAEYLPFIPR
jgi:CRISP-associated protein Cas1